MTLLLLFNGEAAQDGTSGLTSVPVAVRGGTWSPGPLSLSAPPVVVGLFGEAPVLTYGPISRTAGRSAVTLTPKGGSFTLVRRINSGRATLPFTVLNTILTPGLLNAQVGHALYPITVLGGIVTFRLPAPGHSETPPVGELVKAGFGVLPPFNPGRIPSYDPGNLEPI
jgi:hypothetical protein